MAIFRPLAGPLLINLFIHSFYSSVHVDANKPSLLPSEQRYLDDMKKCKCDQSEEKPPRGKKLLNVMSVSKPLTISYFSMPVTDQ